MLKFQIILIFILIGCMAFMSCDTTQDALEDVMMDPPPEMMVMIPESAEYMSWMNKVELQGALMEFGGEAHDLGARTVYFNESAATANMEGTEYPSGAWIVKVSKDTTDTFDSQVSMMMKTDSTDNDGWVYVVSGPPAATAEELMMPHKLTAEMGAQNCHSCHAKAPKGKSVFVSLMSSGPDDGAGNGDGTGNGANGDTGNGNGDTNGDANGDTNGDANGDANGDTNGDANGDTNGDGDTGNGNGDTGNGDGDTGNGDGDTGNGNGDTGNGSA